MEIEKLLGAETEENYNIFLIDGSIGKLKKNRDFFRYLFNNFSYGSLDIKKVQEKIEESEEFIQILQHPRTRTILEVTQELTKGLKILGEDIKYYNSTESSKGKRAKKRHSERTEIRKEFLEELQEKLYLISHLSRQKELQKDKELVINPRKYRSLVDIIKFLSREMNLKTDMSYVLGVRDEDRAYLSDTDEKLVAALYYLSMYSSKKPIILTGDRDILEIITKTPDILGAREFFPYNKDFIDALNLNLFDLYFQNGDGYALPIKNWKPKCKNKARIKGATPCKGIAIRERVKRFWHKFSED